MSKIILLGYMGVGKSTLGELLSKVNRHHFFDLDAQIEESFGLSVQDIFKSKGELAFRKEEKRQLHQIMNMDTDIVLSLGGGTPLYYNNADFIFDTESFKTVYLTSSLNHLVKRLLNEKEQRPLISHLKTEAELEDFIRKHLFERHHIYDRAQYQLNVDDKSPSESVDELLNLLNVH